MRTQNAAAAFNAQFTRLSLRCSGGLLHLACVLFRSIGSRFPKTCATAGCTWLQGVAPGKGRDARTSSHRFALSNACAPALSHIPSRPSIPIAERSKGHRNRSRLDTIVAPSVIDIGPQSRLHRYPLASRLPVANPQQQHQPHSAPRRRIELDSSTRLHLC